MASLAAYRASLTNQPLTTQQWREIVKRGDPDDTLAAHHAFQHFARMPVLSDHNSAPYCIEGYKLCPATLAACDGDIALFERLLDKIGRGDSGDDNLGIGSDLYNQESARKEDRRVSEDRQKECHPANYVGNEQETGNLDANDAGTPEANDTETPESNDAVTPEANDRAPPESNDAETPESNDAAPPESNDAETPESNDAVTPEANDAVTQQAKDAQTQEANDADTPEAKQQGDSELLQDVLNEALSMVIRSHKMEMIRYLLHRGADANTTSPLTGTSVLAAICSDYYITEDENIQIVELMIQHGATDLPGAMHGAAYNYRVRMLGYLLNLGAPASGYQLIGPITRAGFDDQFEVPKILLEHRADPNYTGSMNNRAIFWAAFHGAANSIKLLLTYGADPDFASGLCLESTVPLHAACLRDYTAVVALLVQACCDVNQPAKVLERSRRNLGDVTILAPELANLMFTPLEALCLANPKQAQADIIELLLSAGAKVRASFLILDQSCYQSPDLYAMIQDMFSEPQTLFLQCIVTIRRCLKGKPSPQLPLPPILTERVLLSRLIQRHTQDLKHFEVIYRT